MAKKTELRLMFSQLGRRAGTVVGSVSVGGKKKKATKRVKGAVSETKTD